MSDFKHNRSKRDINWVSRCAEYLNDCEKRPFNWGEFDCCLFAADWVQLQFGFDPAKSYRNHYSTEIGAARALKRYGAQTTDLKKTWSNALGLTAKQSIAANRGDVVLVDVDGVEAVGVCYGNTVFVLSPAGIVKIPMTNITCFWSLAELVN